MEYVPTPIFYASLKRDTKLVDSKEYLLNLKGESYSLLIIIYSDNKICFKLKDINKLSAFYYTKEYKYDEIIKHLQLNKNHYEDLSKILLYFGKIIQNKKIALSYNEENKKMILQITRVEDFEEFQIPIELIDKKLSSDEMFQLLFEEINEIKINNNKTIEEGKDREIINNLMNKSKEHEEYITILENKIIKLEKTIEAFKNKINENNIKNSEDINNFKNNMNKNVDDKLKSFNDMTNSINEKINENNNSVNNFIVIINERIEENNKSINDIINKKINENTKSINFLKGSIDNKINEYMKIVDKKLDENMSEINYNLQQFNNMKDIDKKIPHPNSFNLKMNKNLNIFPLDKTKKNNQNPFIVFNFNECDDYMNIVEQVIINCSLEDELEEVINKYKKESKRPNLGKKLMFLFKNKELNNFQLSVSQIGVEKGKINNIIVMVK